MTLNKLVVAMCALVFLASSPSARGQDLLRILPGDRPITAAQSEQISAISAIPSTERISIVEVDTSVLKGNATVSIPLSEGRSVKLTSEDTVSGLARNFSWSGETDSRSVQKSRDWAEATITVEGDRVAATIRTRNEIYRIQPIEDGLHVLIKISGEKLPPDHGRLPRDEPGVRQIVPREDLRARSDRSTAVLTVLVLVTPRAEKGIGSSNLRLFSRNAADVTNRSFVNSGVRARVRVASVRRVQYVESGSIIRDTSRLAGRADGYMDGIHAVRDEVKADLTILLSAHDTECGWAKVYADASSAFGSVYFDCAVNSLSFAHEIGHLLGACHNPEVSTGCPFNYSHGFIKPARRERTVMAYDCPNVRCTRRPQWSRPPNWGTARRHHAARLIDETAPRASRFR